MEEPQIYALLGEWNSFKDYFKKDDQRAADLIEPFNLAGNTAIHIAARTDDPNLIRELLDILPEDSDRRKALREGNAHKNTLIHQVVISCENLDMVNTLLDYEMEKKLKQPGEENLLELVNDIGETPVYRAAKYGRLRMLKRMTRYVDNMEPHLYRNSDFASILHIAIIGHHFDVAMWLSKMEVIKNVVSAYGEDINEKVEPDENEGNESDKDENFRMSCLQLLSKMPSVFRSSNSQAGFVHNLIYDCLPNKGYDDEEDEDEDDVSRRGKEDLESGKNKVKKSFSPPAVSSTIYYVICKLVAKEWDSVKEIWKKKQKNMQAKEVADFLVRIDNSWRDNHGDGPRTEVVLPVIQPTNVAKTRKAFLEKTSSILKPVKCKDYTPLLLAASTGIIEIVEKIIDFHPDAVSHVQRNEENVLHITVKHRQKKIYKHLKKLKVLDGLGSQITSRHNRTLLHQVARMDYYDGGNQPGVVFQLQEELQWFEVVKKIVPSHYQMYCNVDKLTARELFDLEHSEMLEKAQEWIKGTAQSCSAVSVLVATVVFAAAYAVPGGTNDHGVPNLIHSPLFLFFTVMDVVGLATSLISVMMFLSILTSPFQMQEFHKSLPRKLTIGFTLLFISLTTTLLAFGSTILLTIWVENPKWSSSLIYSATFFPVTLFGLTQFPIVTFFEQFPIVRDISHRMKRLRKRVRKIIDIITMSKKPTRKRDYSKYL
ncbi:hypothetical protein QN277_009063 [Acacia crassicarpa]|uniref:PGG domain-containing protein n=1 Tax=Acacia crassicarpa TaxID=499986 RepID=A0AAE1JN51_9FABA|nr:hypothetical protein QN277_009063 [Acacia crassicarpa]